MGKLVACIRRLHKKKIITEKPHPIWPFILGFVSLLLSFLAFRIKFKSFGFWFFGISIFAFLFAILHLIVWLVIRKFHKS